MDTNKRIVVNTLAQHIRAVLNIGMSLFATRFILQALGNSDFGIFSLIGSTVAMLGFITNALVVTTQRHLSFSHGAGLSDETRRIFANSLFVHIVMCIALMVILVAIEPFLFCGFLEIDDSKIPTAKQVYFIVMAMLLLSVITSPYRAVFIARENIVYISIIDFLDGFIRLALSIALLYVSHDRLITYTWMMFSISTFNLLAFALYARRKFPETCLWPKRENINKSTIFKIIDFAGWTIYSTGCIIGRNQGMAIVLNTFFGTIINTAYGIASQVCNAVQFVSQAVINAMSPQIIKAEGNLERHHMLSLAEVSCKYSFLLLAILVIPICFEMPDLLKIWLGETPESTAEISRFILVATLVDQTTLGLGIANQAIGNIRNYSLTVNTIKVMTLPIAYLSLALGFDIIITMWCYVGIEGICAITRLPFLKHTAGLSIRHYTGKVLMKIFFPTLTLILVGYLCTSTITTQYRFFLTFLLSFMAGAISIWTTSLSDKEEDISLHLFKR